MMTWNTTTTTTPATLDDASFTPEQQERLLALRARLHDQSDPGEFGLDLRRLALGHSSTHSFLLLDCLV
jgi:hypothetical protein